MEYTTALSIAKKAATFLEDGEGNMSTAEVVLHVSALDMALTTIAKRNAVTLPDRNTTLKG